MIENNLVSNSPSLNRPINYGKLVLPLLIFSLLLLPLVFFQAITEKKVTPTKKAAEGNASFSFNPNTMTVNPGQEFEVEVKIDTAGQLVGGALVKIDFNPNTFTALEITPGNEISQVPPMFPVVLRKLIDNSMGRIYLDAGVEVENPQYYLGQGTFGKIRFLVKDQTVTDSKTISFFLTEASNPQALDDCDIIGAQDKVGQDLLSQVSNLNINIDLSTGGAGNDQTPVGSSSDADEATLFFKAGFKGYSITNQPEMLVILKAVGTTFSQKTTLNEAGESAAVPLTGLNVDQTYDFILSSSGFLSEKKSLTINGGRNPASDFFDFGVLRSGDLNSDGQINGLDWSLMKINFGESNPE